MRKRYRSTIDQEQIEEPIVNLTPLIDVVFVVLITFILIAPVLEVDSVDLAEAGIVEKKQIEPSSISISVQKDNTITYQKKKVTLKELEKLLSIERKRNPNAIPQILHDKQAEFGTYQAIKNICESLGFMQMDVILKPR